MSHQAVFEYVQNHPSGRVKIAVADIDGVLRGKYISSEKFLSVAQSHLGFCDVIFGWDMADVAYDNGTYTGWHSGKSIKDGRGFAKLLKQLINH